MIGREISGGGRWLAQTPEYLFDVGRGGHRMDVVSRYDGRHPAKAVGPHLRAGPRCDDLHMVKVRRSPDNVLEYQVIADHREIELKLVFAKITLGDFCANHVSDATDHAGVLTEQFDQLSGRDPRRVGDIIAGENIDRLVIDFMIEQFPK